MKTNVFVLLMLFLQSSLVNAQDTIAERKLSIPIGIFTSDNRDIYGLSVGIGSDLYMDSEAVGVRSNGIRIEPLSSSLLIATLFSDQKRSDILKSRKNLRLSPKKCLTRLLMVLICHAVQMLLPM